MKSLSDRIQEQTTFITSKGLRSVSFDIDGTVYPIQKVQFKWWCKLITDPKRAMKFLTIKKTWEKRRQGNNLVPVGPEDVSFFETFLAELLVPQLVPIEIHSWLKELKDQGITIFFLSDHGALIKLQKLNLLSYGVGINCLTESGELKPHEKITNLLLNQYGIQPSAHLHLGDRWTDEEQAKLLGCFFNYFQP